MGRRTRCAAEPASLPISGRRRRRPAPATSSCSTARTDHEWMAIGRIGHDPRRATEGDGKWWTFIQWLPVRSPLSYDDARRAPELADWRKLTQMAGRHAEISPAGAGSTCCAVSAAATRRPRPGCSPGSARTVGCHASTRRISSTRPGSPARHRSGCPTNTRRSSHGDIEELLVKRRKARVRTDSDALAIGNQSTVCLSPPVPNGGSPTSCWWTAAGTARCFSSRSSWHARLSELRGGRDVVDQVLEYQALIAALEPTWTVPSGHRRRARQGQRGAARRRRRGRRLALQSPHRALRSARRPVRLERSTRAVPRSRLFRGPFRPRPSLILAWAPSCRLDASGGRRTTPSW